MDNYYLIERSAVMAEPWGESTRWEAVVEALVRSEFREERGVWFSAPPKLRVADTCDPRNYALPFEVGTVPGVETNPVGEAILKLPPPSGRNPLLAALTGLIAFAKQRRAGSGWKARVVLFTASAPDQCPGDAKTSDVVKVLAEAGMLTAVIALEPRYDVDPLAAVSGSLPFRIGPENAADQVRDALGQLRSCRGLHQADSCSPFDLSEIFSGPTNLDSVSLSGLGPKGTEAIPHLAGPEACAQSPNGGFYLDQGQSGVLLHFCPCSCVRAQWFDSKTYRYACP